MKRGICIIGFVALRAAPTHKSEMVSQLCFGDTFTVLEVENGWKYISMDYDNYQGWIHSSQMTTIPDEDYKHLNDCEHALAGDALGIIRQSDGARFHISAGSSLYINSSGIMKVAGKTFHYEGSRVSPQKMEMEKITEVASVFLNTPYLWGGRTVFGMDCSGFTQVVFKMLGIKLPRDANIQSGTGDPVHLIHEAQPGDLAFFGKPEEGIDHVGILCGDNTIIHSHGMVRLDKIDHQGIFNTSTGKYSHFLRLIKRVRP